MRGQLFVPKRGQMEPPSDDMLEESETVTTVMTSTSDYTSNFSSSPSIEITPPSNHALNKAPQALEPPKPKKGKKETEPSKSVGEENQLKPKKKKKKKKSSKSDLKIDDNLSENSDEPGKGGSKQTVVSANQ